MARVIIATGFVGADGREEVLSEYQCDCPDCPNPAERAMGFAREFGGGFAVCAEHAAQLERRSGIDGVNEDPQT